MCVPILYVFGSLGTRLAPHFNWNIQSVFFFFSKCFQSGRIHTAENGAIPLIRIIRALRSVIHLFAAV